jgi:beta-glucanase (GH16 family)
MMRILVATAALALVQAAWVLQWEDDFDGTALNTSIWTPRLNESHCEPCELELYIGSALTVANGTLTITTKREQAIGPGGQLFNYTSGWVDTKGKQAQLYGRFEARGILPAQNATGAWPAFWTLSNSTACWPTQGEIDVFEYIANPLVNEVFGSYRWGTQCGVDEQVLPGAGFALPAGQSWSDSYHVFAVEWNATAISFFVDDILYETKTSSEVILPSSPQYIILNTAVEPWLAPQADAAYPATYVIDYVRVYAYQP